MVIVLSRGGFVSNDVIIELELPIHFDTARPPAALIPYCHLRHTNTLTKNWAGVASGHDRSGHDFYKIIPLVSLKRCHRYGFIF